jgi:hypothetical protein
VKKAKHFGAALLAVALAVPAMAANEANDSSYPAVYAVAAPMAPLNIPPARARMSSELALNTYEAEARWQAQQLGESDDTTTITAELPDAAKRGQYRLKRVYSAPRTLAFKTIDFTGDGFVKSNVIYRLLQSEAEHVKKAQPGDTAITCANYKFSYKGMQVVDGRLTHAFQVKPRQKRAGLFKGMVYIDSYTAGMVRAEGRVVKSPSMFIKRIDFVQDYAQIGDFNVITHIHSVADTRLIGRAIVDITHGDYQVRTLTEVLAEASSPPRVVAASYREDAPGK